MKISSITISGMHNVNKKKYSFEDINYLYGPNGAGKSTVLEAIQLAILGYIPGTAKQTAHIFKHSNGPEMKIRIELDTGKYVERIWATKGRSIETKVNTDTGYDNVADLAGDLELPIFNFNELIGMTANKLKDWFINFLPNNSYDIDWEKEFEDSIKGLKMMDPSILTSALDLIKESSDEDTLSIIQMLNQNFKDEQSYLKGELKRSESTIQSLVYYDEEEITGEPDELDAMVVDARQQIQMITKTKEDLIAAQQIRDNNLRVHNQLKTLNVPDVDEELIRNKLEEIPNEISDIESEIKLLQVEISDCEQKEQDILSQISDYKAEIKAKEQIISSEGICPYTSSKCESIIKMIDEMKLTIGKLKLEQDIANENGQNNHRHLDELRDEVNNLRQKISMKQSEANQLKSQLTSVSLASNQKNQLESLLQDEPDMSKFRDVQFYTTEINNLNDKITKIEANKKYNQLIDQLTKEKFKIENSIEIYKCWIKLTDPNGLQTRIMNEPFKNFASDMNPYLKKMFGEDVECAFNLEQKANSFSFGVQRGDQYISYELLSSGEKTMYTLAMMLCIIDKSNSSLRVLIVDDMLDHLDNSRADDVFEAISKVTDTQIIAAGVKNSENASSYTIEVS